MSFSEAYYLVAQPCSSLEQSLPSVLVHNQPTSLWRDRTHRGGLGRGGPVQPRHLWRNTARSAIRLGLQGGRTERGGGAGLDWRAGIMIRRGGSLPRSATLLTHLRRERERERECYSHRHRADGTHIHTRTLKGTTHRRQGGAVRTLTQRCNCFWQIQNWQKYEILSVVTIMPNSIQDE